MFLGDYTEYEIGVLERYRKLVHIGYSKSEFDKFLKSGYEIVAVIMRDGEEWI